jgi:hypothetical protein
MLDTKKAVYDPASNLVYFPFIAEDGRVGYQVNTTYGDPDAERETFIYFNPSDTSGDDTPNVFVYMGEDNDPAHDEPMHFYAIEFDED